jgi:hypothetical protein
MIGHELPIPMLLLAAAWHATRFVVGRWTELTLVALVFGLGAAFLVRFATPRRAMLRFRSGMAASVYRLWVYRRLPSQVIRAEYRLILNNLGLLLCLAPTILVCSIALIVAWDHLDARYGRSPFRAGDEIVLRATAQDSALPLRALDVTPVDRRVEVIARVRNEAKRTVWTRLRVTQPGLLPLRAGGQPLLLNVAHDAAPTLVSQVGVGSTVTAPYPPRNTQFPGGWIAYFSLVCLLTPWPVLRLITTSDPEGAA